MSQLYSFLAVNYCRTAGQPDSVTGRFGVTADRAPWRCYLGLTFVSEGDLSAEGVDEEHVTGGNSRRLFHEGEAQLCVDGTALVAVLCLHLHERDS